MKISILCASKNSNYFSLADKYDLDIYDKARDCRNFEFNTPVITHAPCAQWSRLHKFAKVDKDEKDLAFFCLDAVNRCSGIFEHPMGSHFFRTAQVDFKKIISVNQSWFDYPGRKCTYLYYNSISFDSLPLNFDAVKVRDITNIGPKSARELTTLKFNEWLITSILNSSK